MDSWVKAVLIGSTVLGSWLGMQAVHESGHALAARLTGGRVARVVLYPLTISRTDLADNPHPLAVAWAGPVVGAAVRVLRLRLVREVVVERLALDQGDVRLGGGRGEQGQSQEGQRSLGHGSGFSPPPYRSPVECERDFGNSD